MRAHALVLFVTLADCLRSRPATDAQRVPTTSTAVDPPARAPVVPPAPPAPAVVAPVEAPLPGATPVRFVIRVTGGASETDQLPLIVAIHGLGDSPEAFVGFVASMGLRARIAAPAGLDRWGDGYSWFPSRADSAHARWVAGIRRAADAMVPAIASLVRQHPTCGLPLVMGFSQGGMLSYAILARDDAHVAAALPIGGLLPRDLWPVAHAWGGLPPSVYAFHGDADARVPIVDDRSANAAFRTAGFHAELREYPGVGHEITPAIARDVRQRLVDVARDLGCPVGS